MVTITGIAEIAGALGMLWTRTAEAAAIGLAVMLIAVFPANARAARERLTLGGRPVPTLAVRAALQIVFLAAVLAAGFGGR